MLGGGEGPGASLGLEPLTGGGIGPCVVVGALSQDVSQGGFHQEAIVASVCWAGEGLLRFMASWRCLSSHWPSGKPLWTVLMQR